MMGNVSRSTPRVVHLLTGGVVVGKKSPRLSQSLPDSVNNDQVGVPGA